ncbi:T9SS type A sorting domain-containing protein [Bernardetia sp. Wsw4-3y2]|uniref:T9SS type A sorting domain-containing protein n=1 Tax=Bernardetia sp. Wsw4-3y2 TaxID=3127471 RepID=UPI0030D35268
MKKYLLILKNCLLFFTFTLIPLFTYSQEWESVGGGNATDGSIFTVDFAFNPITNEPYVFYTDISDRYEPSKLVVKRFDGERWVIVGQENFSLSSEVAMKIDFTSVGQAYIASLNNTNEKTNISIRRLEGNVWTEITPPISNSYTSVIYELGLNMFIEPFTDKCFISYVSINTDIRDAPSRLSVMSFTGRRWEQLGESLPEGIYGTTRYNKVTKEVYVVYTKSEEDKLTIRHFDGNEWVLLGGELVSEEKTYFEDMAFNPISGEPHMVYQEEYDDGFFEPAPRFKISRFDGTNWVELPLPDRLYPSGQDSDLSFHPVTAEPYFICSDPNEYFKSSILKFSDSYWQYVGSKTIDGSYSSNYQSVKFHPITSEPYILYSQGGIYENTTFIRKFVSPPLTGSVPPAPTGLSTIEVLAKKISISWNSTDNATNYKIYKDELLVGTISSQQTTYQFSNLDEETNYLVKVVAINNIGTETIQSTPAYLKVRTTKGEDTVTGIEDVKNTLFELYPNPNDGIFTIQFMIPISEEIQINVVDVLGRNQTVQLNKTTQRVTINMNQLSKGIYFVQLTKGGKMYSEKILIK